MVRVHPNFGRRWDVTVLKIGACFVTAGGYAMAILRLPYSAAAFDMAAAATATALAPGAVLLAFGCASEVIKYTHIHIHIYIERYIDR